MAAHELFFPNSDVSCPLSSRSSSPSLFPSLSPPLSLPQANPRLSPTFTPYKDQHNMFKGLLDIWNTLGTNQGDGWVQKTQVSPAPVASETPTLFPVKL